MTNYNKKAFSLIEISIVILIIGLLIAGVSKATDMLAESKIKGARSIAKGSIVPRLPNLILWLDVAQSESWPDNKRGTQAYNSSVWTDVNPQNLSNVGFKFSGSFNYFENNGSNLPKLKVLTADIDSAIVPSGSFFDLDKKGFTFFIVATQSLNQKTISFCQTSSCATNQAIHVEFVSSKASVTYPSESAASSSAVVSIPSTYNFGGDLIEIITVAGNDSNVNIFGMGKNRGKPSTAAGNFPLSQGLFKLNLGAELYEVILVGEYMDDVSRKKVQNYLFDKYGVPSTGRGEIDFSAT